MTKQKENSCPVLDELHEMVNILHDEVCKHCDNCNSDNPECALRNFIDGYTGLYDVEIDYKISDKKLKFIKGLIFND